MPLKDSQKRMKKPHCVRSFSEKFRFNSELLGQHQFQTLLGKAFSFQVCSSSSRESPENNSCCVWKPHWHCTGEVSPTIHIYLYESQGYLCFEIKFDINARWGDKRNIIVCATQVWNAAFKELCIAEVEKPSKILILLIFSSAAAPERHLDVEMFACMTPQKNQILFPEVLSAPLKFKQDSCCRRRSTNQWKGNLK